MMKVSFLTSGFPNGFTDEFIRRLKNYHNNAGLFAFIAPDFSGPARTDEYACRFVSMFKGVS